MKHDEWGWITGFNDVSLPGFNRLRMHTQLKQQPMPLLPHISNPMTIQQFATQQQQQQQGTKTSNSISAANNNNIPVAFVEFRDVQSAGQAMQLLQGKYLLSSDRGAIRIEYAKSKMAANEHMIATYPAPINGRSHY